MASAIRSTVDGTPPTFAHPVEAFLAAHTRAGAWSTGTRVKYRKTLTALTALTALADELTGAQVARTVAALDTHAGTAALDAAFNTADGALAPAARARHLATLRSSWSATPPPAGPGPSSPATTAAP